MTATVPEYRIDLEQDDALVSATVRSATWINAARLHNWIAGRPTVVVPCTVPRDSIPAGNSAEYPFRYDPRYQDVSYRYALLLTAETPCTADIEINGVSVGSGFRVEQQRNAAWFVFDQELASQSTTEGELKFKVSAVGGTVNVDGLQVEALPRVFLAIDANDLGADRFPLWIRAPISERTFATNLLDKQASLRDAARRAGFHHSWGTLNPFTTTSATFVGLFEDSVSLLGRYLYSGDTTRTMGWRVKALCSDGTTAGEVRITNNAGTSTITVAAGTTSSTWLPSTAGAATTFSIDAEDNTTSDGLRGAATDDHTFEARRTAGAGSLKIESISVWEP